MFAIDRIRTDVVSLLVGTMLIATYASAQVLQACAVADSTAAGRQCATTVKTVTSNAASGLSSPLRSPSPAFELKTSSDSKEKIAKATVGMVRSGGKHVTLGGTIGFEGPLSDDGETSTVGSLTGLAEGTKFTAGITFYRWHANVDYVDIFHRCASFLKAHKKNDDPAFKDIVEVDGTWCSFGSVLLSNAENAELSPSVTLNSTPISFGLLAKAGRDEFKWSEPTSVTDSARTENSFSVGTTAAVYSRNWKTLFLGTAEFARGVKSADTTLLCTPIANTARTACKNIALEAPKFKKTVVLGAEARRFLSSNVMLGISGAYDTKDRKYELSLPLYFLRSAAGLNGGIAGKYSSREKSFGLTVFVGGNASTAVSGAVQ